MTLTEWRCYTFGGMAAALLALYLIYAWCKSRKRVTIDPQVYRNTEGDWCFVCVCGHVQNRGADSTIPMRCSRVGCRTDFQQHWH